LEHDQPGAGELLAVFGLPLRLVVFYGRAFIVAGRRRPVEVAGRRNTDAPEGVAIFFALGDRDLLALLYGLDDFRPAV
jgi:hypothetical protein